MCPVQQIYFALHTSHSGFPVINRAGNLVGMMPRRFIKILLKKREFMSGSGIGNASTQGMASAKANLFFSGQREGQNTYRSGFGYT